MTSKTTESKPSAASSFDFMGLPLELRRMVYGFADLKVRGNESTESFTSDRLLEYATGKEVGIPLIDTCRAVRNEAFEYVLQQNRIVLQEDKEVDITFPLKIPKIIDYINKTSVSMDRFYSLVDEAQFTANATFENEAIECLKRCDDLDTLVLWSLSSTVQTRSPLFSPEFLEVVSNIPTLRFGELVIEEDTDCPWHKEEDNVRISIAQDDMADALRGYLPRTRIVWWSANGPPEYMSWGRPFIFR